MPPFGRAAPSGFSLIELIAVIAVLGALSLTAIPAMRSINSSRASALAAEVERRLLLARAFAMATSQPAGARFDLNDQTIAMLRIASPDDDPSPMPGATGRPMPELAITGTFPSAEITHVNNGDGLSGTGAIWFAADGSPMVRDAGGFSDFTRDARLTVTGSRTITVRQVTGMTER